jgi:hypothetical protein
MEEYRKLHGVHQNDQRYDLEGKEISQRHHSIQQDHQQPKNSHDGQPRNSMQKQLVVGKGATKGGDTGSTVHLLQEVQELRGMFDDHNEKLRKSHAELRQMKEQMREVLRMLKGALDSRKRRGTETETEAETESRSDKRKWRKVGENSCNDGDSMILKEPDKMYLDVETVDVMDVAEESLNETEFGVEIVCEELNEHRPDQDCSLKDDALKTDDCDGIESGDQRKNADVCKTVLLDCHNDESDSQVGSEHDMTDNSKDISTNKENTTTATIHSPSATSTTQLHSPTINSSSSINSNITIQPTQRTSMSYNDLQALIDSIKSKRQQEQHQQQGSPQQIQSQVQSPVPQQQQQQQQEQQSQKQRDGQPRISFFPFVSPFFSRVFSTSKRSSVSLSEFETKDGNDEQV